MNTHTSEVSFRNVPVRAIWRALAGAACIVMAVVGIPGIASAQSASIPSTAAFACDFESGPCGLNEQSKIGDSFPSRASIVTGVSRAGSHALRLHTEPGDNSVHGSGTWERDDMMLPPSSSYCNEGQDEWWAFSVLFPDDYSFPAPGQGGVIVDFHHNADSGLPNLGIEVRGESGMRISGYGGASLNGGQYRTQIADPWGAVNNVTHNQWYDFVLHVKWSSHGDGVSDLWLNGKKVQSYSGATLYSGISCYLKLANYHDATGKASSIIFDRVLRGSNAADVAIGGLEGVSGFFAPSTSPTGGTSGGTNGGTSGGTTGGTTGGTSGGTTGGTSTGTGSSSGGSASSGGSTASSATMDSSAYTSGAGQKVTFTARIIGNGTAPTGTVSFASDGAPIAGCASVPLSGGVANCTTSALSGGQHKITGAYSGDRTYGAAQAGPITQTVSGTAGSTTATTQSAPVGMMNVQGLWWGGQSESGWGINLAQQGSIVFATWFTYDAQGNGMWLVMSDGRATGPNSYAGTLYRTTGPALASTFDGTKVAVSAAGNASFTFSDANHGTFSATVDGVSVTKSITRQVFDARTPVCTEGGNAASTANYQDLWWRLGGAESGWGLNLAHQGNTMFLTWYTYDESGAPMWLVASNVARQADGSYAGTLYRTTGPAFDSATWDPSRVAVTPVGSVQFSFSDGANGTFTYTVNGTTGTKPISRQVFSTPATVCTAG